MHTDFWDLVDRTRPSGGEPSRHADALVDALVASGLDVTLAFGADFDAAVDALHRWDLWGASYLALGGCGDDAFEYLRCWIVGRGEATWELAQRDPEGLFVDLLAGAVDPDERWAALGLHDGEPLLYAAGTAHERLTAVWRPGRESPGPPEPSGEPWDEAELPDRFPRLLAALPAGWWDAGTAEDPAPFGDPAAPGADPLLDVLGEGLLAFAGGDHVRSAAILQPVLEDPAQWRRVAEVGVVPADVAYAVAMGRFVAGDPDGAARALHQVADAGGVEPHVRRALAQIELARGELDAADALLDHADDAELMDRALVAVLRWRRGDAAGARERARAVLAQEAPAPHEHPWDLAGALLQVGLVLVELGDGPGAARAAGTIAELTRGAPAALPLLHQQRILHAGAHRLAGDAAAARADLTGLADQVEGCDRGLVLVEEARQALAGPADASAAQVAEAAARYAAAVAAFRSAGEWWHATATEAEAGGLAGAGGGSEGA